MKRWIIGCLTVCAMLPALGYEHLISYTLYKTITAEDYRATMNRRHIPKALTPAHYTVDIYDVTYYTEWHDGSKIKATGLYFIPRNSGKPLPEIIYHHGTRMNKGRSADLGGEDYLCLGMAADGYLVLEPDYIGLGNGDKFHLYQLASSIGQGSVDMLFAAREMDEELKAKQNDMLFLTGYSEGGYSTLATERLIQEKYADKLHVTASSPMSGAYDMCGAQSEVMFKPYDHPHYLPYLLRAYNEVYHFTPDLSTIYRHPYDSLIPLLFDGKHNIRQIDDQLPHIPVTMITDSFVNQFTHNPNYPLNVALRENSLCDWKPVTPVQLCYCDSDEQVSPKNAFAAYNGMKKMGAKHITLIDADKNLHHSRCAMIAIFYTKMYFDSFKKGSKYGGRGPVRERIMIDIAKKVLEKRGNKHPEKRS